MLLSKIVRGAQPNAFYGQSGAISGIFAKKKRPKQTD